MERLLYSLASVALLGTIVWACKSSAVGVDTCKQIENALCARAPSCGVDIGSSSTPKHSSELTSVAACQQFYALECLHGLETTSVPSSTEVQDCIGAINTQAEGCDGGLLITSPQTAALNGVCSWLAPPAAPVVVDSGLATDGPVAETGADAGADSASGDSGLIIISP